MTNVNEILRDHVTLTVDCMDRLYLNGYMPNLQVPGQLVNFPDSSGICGFGKNEA